MKVELRPVRIKLMGSDAEDLLEVSDKLRDFYQPGVVQSELKNSDGGDYHCFLTVYLKEEPRHE